MNEVAVYASAKGRVGQAPQSPISHSVSLTSKAIRLTYCRVHGVWLVVYVPLCGFQGQGKSVLKVHKNENFFGFDFEFCPISLLVMHK